MRTVGNGVFRNAVLPDGVSVWVRLVSLLCSAVQSTRPVAGRHAGLRRLG